MPTTQSETPSQALPTITAVSTGTTIFIGRCLEGPFDAPQLVHSIGEFSEIFGHDTGDSEMLDQVKLFFANGGAEAYILRSPCLEDGNAPWSVYKNTLSILNSYHSDVRFGIIVLPKTGAAQSDQERVRVYQRASLFAAQCNALLVADPPEGWESIEHMGNLLDPTGCHVGVFQDSPSKRHVAVYWPRLRIHSGLRESRLVGPSGAVAGIMARTDRHHGAWKAPAGLQADVRGILGLEHLVSNEENGVLNGWGVNAIRAFPQNTVCWGARTLDGFDDTDNVTDYKYVPVSRLSCMIEESLGRGLQFTRTAPLDDNLCAQVRVAVGSFMYNLFRQGAFKGDKILGAYSVDVEADEDLGLVRVLVGFAPLKPGGFVTIKLILRAGDTA